MRYNSRTIILIYCTLVHERYHAVTAHDYPTTISVGVQY
jgi:hypothetical protein